MKPVERKITASIDGKVLYLQVEGELLSVPWRDSYFYAGEKVRVAIEKQNEQVSYVITPYDNRLPKRETNWKVDSNGISSQITG